MGGTNAQLPAGCQMSLPGHRAHARGVHSPTNPFSAQFMGLTAAVTGKIDVCGSVDVRPGKKVTSASP